MANALRSSVTLVSLLSELIAFPTYAKAASSRVQGAASIQVGSQTLDYSDYARTEVSAELWARGPHWPVGIALYGSRSFESLTCAIECGDVRERVTQAGLGLRREWAVRVFRPYLGAGVGWGEHRIDIEEPDGALPRYSSQGRGWWAAGGGLFRVARHLNLGAGVRYSHLDLQRSPYFYSDLSGWSIHGSVGLAWPAIEK
jgi:hypothetical protein